MKVKAISEEIYEIECGTAHYREVNQKVRELVSRGARKIILKEVYGQRYIGTGIKGNVKLEVYGTAGNDLGIFLYGPEIEVFGNAQDGVGNTMMAGKIVVRGHAGDVCGYGMRGGKVYIEGNVGYRVGIHMKGYKDLVPTFIVGGKAGNFFGEYMAGGILILLGLNKKPGEDIVGDYCATGMHGGVIYVRGEVPKRYLGKEVKVFELNDEDLKLLTSELKGFSEAFNIPVEEIISEPFTKIVPVSARPYGRLYAHRWGIASGLIK
jgi:glutamate synthase domain-containing protein 3